MNKVGGGTTHAKHGCGRGNMGEVVGLGVNGDESWEAL